MEEVEAAVAEKGRKAGADGAAGKEEAEAEKTAAANKFLVLLAFPRRGTTATDAAWSLKSSSRF